MSNYICRRKTDSTKEDSFSKSGKRRLLSQAWMRVDGGLMFLMSFIFCTGCMHRVHFTSSTRVLRKRQEVYILRGVLNFQRVRNLLGVQLPYTRK